MYRSAEGHAQSQGMEKILLCLGDAQQREKHSYSFCFPDIFCFLVLPFFINFKWINAEPSQRHWKLGAVCALPTCPSAFQKVLQAGDMSNNACNVGRSVRWGRMLNRAAGSQMERIKPGKTWCGCSQYLFSLLGFAMSYVPHLL